MLLFINLLVTVLVSVKIKKTKRENIRIKFDERERSAHTLCHLGVFFLKLHEVWSRDSCQLLFCIGYTCPICTEKCAKNFQSGCTQLQP